MSVPARFSFRARLARTVASVWLLAGLALPGPGQAAGPSAPSHPSAPAQKRVALVVGNSAYSDVPALPNPVNDASDMCKALRDLKFDTLCFLNIKSRKEFKQRVQEFKAKLGPGTAGLFYYAGHGVQIDGENYLIPTAAQIKQKEDVEDETLSLRFLMASLDEAQNEFNLIILDACRNNPFSRGFSRAVGRGLAPISDTPAGSLVLYATAANEQASDGATGERNSPFAKHLLANIKQPNLNVEGLIKKVSAAVQEDTAKAGGKRQVPFNYGSFTGEFCFAGCNVSQGDSAELDKLRLENAKLEQQHKDELARMAADLKRQAEAAAAKATEPTAPAPAQKPKVVVPPAF
jgi:uncharacterized caspase-like protein